MWNNFMFMIKQKAWVCKKMKHKYKKYKYKKLIKGPYYKKN